MSANAQSKLPIRRVNPSDCGRNMAVLTENTIKR